uniref:ATP-dependent RNA helicase n=1 Tax=Oncorhynchus tshawytscha TaxID=74940 RepID=A0A8C8IDU8_ONCTS
ESRSKVLLAKLQRKTKVKEQQSLACQGEHKSKTIVQNDRDTSAKKKIKNKGDNLEETKRPKKRKEQVNQHYNIHRIHFYICIPYFVFASLLVLRWDDFEKKIIQKVQRVLPQWLTEPDVIQRDITSNLVPISDVPGICTRLQRKLEGNGIQHLFPVHVEVIPVILENVSWSVDRKRGYKPRNICVSAPTGSGKTGNQFDLPMSSYAEGTSLKVVIIAGQKFFAKEQASGGTSHSLADIVVATPGRLVDHINKFGTPPLPCGSLIQIIDEADRMIDSMHQSWLSQVTKAVYRSKRGSEALLFSATLTQNPEKLQQLGLHQPRLFSSSQERFNFPQGLTYYVPCTLTKRPLLILHFILCLKFSPILCFTNSRESAHRLCLLVQLFSGVQAAEFSSRLPMTGGEPLRSLNRERLLTSTDAAARGIVINGVKCVVNYDAPQFFRTYIYLCWKRVGKTARAGKALTKQNSTQRAMEMIVHKVQNGTQSQGHSRQSSIIHGGVTRYRTARENRWYSRLDELATDRTQV